MKKNYNQKGFIGRLIIFILLLILISGGIYIYLKLPLTLPGDELYPLKGVLEELRLSVNEFNYSNKALIYLDLTNIRMEEVKGLVKKRKYNDVKTALLNLTDTQAKAIKGIKLAQVHGDPITERISQFEEKFQKQSDDLQVLLNDLPFEFYDQINEIKNSIDINVNELKNLQGKI